MKYLIVGIVVVVYIAVALYVMHRGDRRIAAARQKLTAALQSESAALGKGEK